LSELALNTVRLIEIQRLSMNKKVHLEFRVRTSAARYISWALSAPVMEFKVGLYFTGELQDHFVGVSLNIHIQ
jgi:hypothetical protein